jgi:hypothetical protein
MMFSLCSHRPMRTRGDMLRFAVAFALIKVRKVVRGLREGLTEDERYAVADAVVKRLKEHGDPWKLEEELPSHSITAGARPWMPEDGEGRRLTVAGKLACSAQRGRFGNGAPLAGN